MSIPLFKEAMRQSIAARRALQTMLDVLLPPQGRNDEQWGIFWVSEGEHSNELEAMLTPPDRCYELKHATLANLIAVKEAIGADFVSASLVAGELRYRVTWKRQP